MLPVYVGVAGVFRIIGETMPAGLVLQALALLSPANKGSARQSYGVMVALHAGRGLSRLE